ncbi:putative ribonuclease H-like domain-containing protein [Tanacetum coccineum]
MKSRFQMSSMGELTFFLGLQVKQKEDGIFISQDKYVAEILKKFDFVSVKTASKPIETHKPLVKDAEASDVDVHLYRSMTGSLMYLTASKPDIMFAVGKSITGRLSFPRQDTYSWQCKKQTIMATSTIEAEYVAAPNCSDLLTNAFDLSMFSSWLLLIMEDVSIHKLPLVKGKQWLCWYSFYVLNKSRLQFCFTKVSTDSAIFVSMDTVSTAKEPLEKIPPRVTAQVAEIKSLKAQVKKLKKQARPFILLHKAWLRAVKRKNQNKKKVLKTSKRRSVFKQGRKTIKSSKDEGKTAKVDEKGENTAQQQSTDRIKADRLLAERVQEAKREQFTVEERAKFLHDIKVYSRAESCSTKELKPLENKPPTKNIKRFDDSFITIGSTEDERKIKEINEGASDPDKKKKFVKEDVSTKVPAKQDVAEQGTKKRKGTIDSEIMERKSFISKLDKVSSPEGDYLCWLTIVNEKFKGNIQKATRSTYDSLGRLEDYDGILNRSNKSLLSGTINKIRRLSLRDCIRLVEFAY